MTQSRGVGLCLTIIRDHSSFGLSQWEMTLQWNLVSHRLSPYPEWSMVISQTIRIYTSITGTWNHAWTSFCNARQYAIASVHKCVPIPHLTHVGIFPKMSWVGICIMWSCIVYISTWHKPCELSIMMMNVLRDGEYGTSRSQYLSRTIYESALSQIWFSHILKLFFCHFWGYLYEFFGVSCFVFYIVNFSDAGDGIFWLLGFNTMPGDALAPKVARASAGMVLAV